MSELNPGWIMVILILLIQTGTIAYFGGKVSQVLKDHDRRLETLEE